MNIKKRILKMKKTLILLVLLIPFVSFGQDSVNKKKIDFESIAFKAKLFTLSQNEYSSKEELINRIENLECVFYGKQDFVFLKIKGRYFCQNNENLFTATWCDRYYYLSYSIEKEFYYFLGGFSKNDIERFTKDFNNSKSISNWDQFVTDKKLIKFLNLISANKIKKAKKEMSEGHGLS
jgi:hypothetical protein